MPPLRLKWRDESVIKSWTLVIKLTNALLWNRGEHNVFHIIGKLLFIISEYMCFVMSLVLLNKRFEDLYKYLSFTNDKTFLTMKNKMIVVLILESYKIKYIFCGEHLSAKKSAFVLNTLFKCPRNLFSEPQPDWGRGCDLREEGICFRSNWDKLWGQYQGQESGCYSVSSVASESPMISQLEAELLMWVGLRPPPDLVRKPKLQPTE